MGRKKKSSSTGGDVHQIKSLNAGHEKMLQWFQTVRFKHILFGGVDEKDVWRKLEELNHLYEESLLAERARYDALLSEYKNRNAEPADEVRDDG